LIRKVYNKYGILSTNPKSIIIPKKENRLMVFKVSASTKIAPMIATGSENKTTKDIPDFRTKPP